MKAVAVWLSILMLSCSGFNKRVSYVLPGDEFLYWCETVDKPWPVSTSEPVGCDKVSRGIWDHYPITITADDLLLPEVAEAVLVFNRQLGFNLFEMDIVGEIEMPDILFMLAGTHPFAAAEAKHMTIEGRHYGGVLVYNGIEKNDRADIMMHELGHLVGLRHDDSHMSIMYAGPGSRAAMFERIDIEALRNIYLPK